MSTNPLNQNQTYLKTEQYQNSANLDARANLHRLYSTATTPWQSWVFTQLQLQPGFSVLECGCGPGWLWRENLAHIPADCAITLTDLSDGMVAEAEAALSEAGPRFAFRSVDVQALPFADATFDVVVANHMLYHVPDIDQAVAEIRRVLKRNGRFIAATNGNNHMRELWELSASMIPHTDLNIASTQLMSQYQLAFRVENGAAILGKQFPTTHYIPYEDSLEITAVEPLIAYILSTIRLQTTLTPEMRQQLHTQLQAELNAHGRIHITKESGIFIATQ
jgi:ubiquinone/menaquinone biosynthesis C-methylase UbiE